MGQPKKSVSQRCHLEGCRVKLSLSQVTCGRCYCGSVYCPTHRHNHNCLFNYREQAKEEIERNLPLIKGEKIYKI